MSDMQKWRVESSSYVVDNKWLHVRSERCIDAHGNVFDPYFVLEYPDWMNCFVIDKEGAMLMVRHYRHGAGEFIPELVSGIVEQNESPETGIVRELEEELGYTGGQIVPLGVSYPNPSYQSNKVFSFLAYDGYCTQAPQLQAGETLEVINMPFSELYKLLHGSTILQSMHLATIFLAIEFIKSSDRSELQEIREILTSNKLTKSLHKRAM
jgi:8-oxo-dGTP pyrophosphatase MutT (NUDIX family)